MRNLLAQARRGVISIEMVVGVSIAGLILVYAMYTVAQFVNNAHVVSEKTQALYLAEDGLELIRFIRDEAWSNVSSLPLNTARYLEVTASAVSVTTTPETVGEYSRSFTLSNVYRDSDDDIVASTTSGSVADPDSKYVTVNVTWDGGTESVSLTSILADITP